MARHPTKFIGFAHRYPFAENAAEELKRAVTELGLRGYKLLAPGLDRPIEDTAAYPVWEMCAELNIPVLIHFGILGNGGGIAWHENINPLKLRRWVPWMGNQTAEVFKAIWPANKAFWDTISRLAGCFGNLCGLSH